jgi:hypothetical protein
MREKKTAQETLAMMKEKEGGDDEIGPNDGLAVVRA